MTFSSRSISEKLQKLGCRSGSGFFWGPQGSLLFTDGDIQAYTLLDFIGPSELARENANKLYPHVGCCYCQSGDKKLHCDKPDSYSYRHSIIDFKDEQSAWDYIEKTMKEAV